MIRALLFYICMFTGSTILFGGFFIFAYIFPRCVPHRVVVWWSRYILFLCKYILGIHYKIIGNTLIEKPVIYASKHQSAWETIAFCSLLNMPAFVIKKELLYVPFLAPYIRGTNLIALDRQKSSDGLRLLISGVEKSLAAKKSVFIFPEGTRTSPDVRGTYKSGIYSLYKRFDIPVIPIALNSGKYWKRRGFLKNKGTICVKFLEAMPKNLGKQEFMHELEKRIEGAMDAL